MTSHIRVKDDANNTENEQPRYLDNRFRRLYSLSAKYKQAETMQKTLLKLSTIANLALNPEQFYPELYQQLQKLITVDRFYIVLCCPRTGELSIPFYADQQQQAAPPENLTQLLRHGLTGYILRTGKALLANPTDIERLYQSGNITRRDNDCLQWLGVPTLAHGHVIGALVVQNRQEEFRFSPSDIALMEFISQHVAGVLERGNEHDEMERAISQHTLKLRQAYNKLKQEVRIRRRAELLQKSLYEIANLAAANLNDNDFYQQIHRVLRHLLPAHNCYIALIDEQTDQLTFPFYVSELASRHPLSRPHQDGLTEYLMAKGHPLLLNHAEITRLMTQGKIYRQAPILNNSNLMHQWIGVPLFIHGRIMGNLAIYSFRDQQQLQNQDVELLTFVSQHIATAIERKLNAAAMQKSFERLEVMVNARTQELGRINQALELEILRRQKVEQQLTYDANHDTLTGLPNRAMFRERLTQAVRHLRRHKTDHFAVLFIDLDRFKLVNDTVGHVEGDHFLIETARRLRTCIRDNDTLARLGGDEFVILLDCIHQKEDVLEIGERVIRVLAAPYELSGQKFRSGASIGIAIATPQDSSETLLKNADNAMYQAKAKGKGCFVIFDPLRPSPRSGDGELADELAPALAAGQIKMQYLPIYKLNGNKIIAQEAKLYWEHPTLGHIHQLRLHTLAEQNGLRKELDNLAISLLINEWSIQSSNLPLHLTLGAESLRQLHSRKQLCHQLVSSNIPLSQLWLFFDEQALVQDSEHHVCSFDALSKTGVNLGISSYGTSFSALASLSFLPISALKLDSCFATHLDSPRHLKLVKACFLAASALDLQVFCTGITSTAQQQAFIDIGIQWGQGPALGHSSYSHPQLHIA